jgi:hypothetical protein
MEALNLRIIQKEFYVHDLRYIVRSAENSIELKGICAKLCLILIFIYLPH